MQKLDEIKANKIEKLVAVYCLRLGDSSLILGQRLCELLGNAPTLEEELALSNFALDYIGQATLLLDIAAKFDNDLLDSTAIADEINADKLAFFRDERQYCNYLLVEQDTNNFADVVVRTWLFSTYLCCIYQRLTQSSCKELADFAEKAIKEVSYHFNHSKNWLIHLGDGTQYSHNKAQAAIDNYFAYTQELFDIDEVELALQNANIIPDKQLISQQWQTHVSETLAAAKLIVPTVYQYKGGITGTHSEHFGRLLAQMQYLPRCYPTATW